MVHGLSIGSLALVAALGIAVPSARAFDDALYPDWSGGWMRLGSGDYDASKPRGLGQKAPYTPEYQKILEDSIAEQEHGGQGDNPGYQCKPHGMPRIMIAIHHIKFVILPETTYALREVGTQLRRIYTDGRDWPATLTKTADGYSIGKWLDEDGDGRYDTLAVETRGIKGPHSYDSSGLPFHKDDEVTFKERIALDKSNRDILHDEITTIDHALTRPWVVTRNYRRNPNPSWTEYDCSEDNHHVVIGKDDYIMREDGLLMPVRKGQKPPDLRYFDQAQP
jgi:hypothetical protein